MNSKILRIRFKRESGMSRNVNEWIWMTSRDDSSPIEDKAWKIFESALCIALYLSVQLLDGEAYVVQILKGDSVRYEFKKF